MAIVALDTSVSDSVGAGNNNIRLRKHDTILSACAVGRGSLAMTVRGCLVVHEQSVSGCEVARIIVNAHSMLVRQFNDECSVPLWVGATNDVCKQFCFLLRCFLDIYSPSYTQLLYDIFYLKTYMFQVCFFHLI
jgi:hypothetical protein